MHGAVIDGRLPPRIAGFVIEWLLLHKKDIEENWNMMRELKSPKKILPLE